MARLVTLWGRFSLLLLILMAAVFPALADVQKTQHAEAELVAEVSSIQPGQAFWVALRLKAEDQWHTYWKNPGDSGLATSIKWELPEGFKAEAIQWPYPERIEVLPLVSYGYEGEVFLLVKITAPANLPETPVKLAATAKWLVCKEACLPGSAKLSLELPVKNETPKPDDKWAASFTATRAKIPSKIEGWQFTANASKERITIVATPPANFKQTITALEFFPLENGIIDNATKASLKPTDKGYLIETKPSADATELPTELAGILISPQGWQGGGQPQALEFKTTVTPTTATNNTSGTMNTPNAGNKKITSLWLAIGLAFIGGLILNLMPCVLPVLSIKVLDFVKQAKKENGKPWQHGLIFTLGVLASFWVLAGILIALRAGGEKLGWGFQLQSPSFLVVLAALFFLFGLNLFGVFEVGTSLMSVGSKATNESGWVGSFASGALATMVATPCTAPFMGSSVGFAMTQPIWASMLIFTAVGLGMSFPYILLSCSPTLLKFVPKPGAWMESFKQFMGFLLMATVVWLIWVLGQQAGIDAVGSLLLSLVVMSIAGWILGRWGSFVNATRTRRIAQTMAVVLITVGLAFALSTARNGSAITANSGKAGDGIAWQTFSPKLIDDLRAAGKPVFIDFGAAWCLSCQVNERVTFSSQEVKDTITKLGIVPIRADWTSRDETITKTLESFGRSGVPLYVLYNPKEANPTILPEVITPEIVLTEFRKLAPETKASTDKTGQPLTETASKN